MGFKKGYTPWNKGKSMPNTTPIEKRLLDRRQITPNGCWEFTGSKDSGGYGHIRFAGKLRKVHRVSAYLYKQFDIDNPLKVLHNCDNAKCFNPEHLWLGTQADNIADMDKKGRRDNSYKIGERNGRAKLTEEQVKEIVIKRRNGIPVIQICTEYDIHKITVWRITSGTNWKHIM